jgi:hypothetical protein
MGQADLLMGNTGDRLNRCGMKRAVLVVMSIPIGVADRLRQRGQPVIQERYYEDQASARGRVCRHHPFRSKSAGAWGRGRQGLRQCLSVHDWLEGRGEQMYLISMIDDATSPHFSQGASKKPPLLA